MELSAQDTALVITDPQNDFLSEDGVTWQLVGDSVKENGTVEHLEQLFKAAKDNGYDVFISPHLLLPDGPQLEVRWHRREDDARHPHVRPLRAVKSGGIRGIRR